MIRSYKTEFNILRKEFDSDFTAEWEQLCYDTLCVGSNFSCEISEPCAAGSREIITDSHRCSSVKDYIILCHVILVSCHIMSYLMMCKTTSRLETVETFTSSPWSNSPGMDSLSAVEFRNRFTGKMPGLISFWDGSPSCLGELGMNHYHPVPSGKRWHEDVKSQFSMDKS